VTFRIPCKNLFQQGQKGSAIERKMETKQLRRLIKKIIYSLLIIDAKI
jgi:hypothetical protein